jgi:hypothetical protein
MGRLLVFVLAAIVLDVFAVVDIAVIDRRRVRAFSKPLWVVIVLVVPFIGALLWFTIGRSWSSPAAQPRSMAPDDDPAFLNRVHIEDQDERIRRLEQELADLDDDPPAKD